MTRNIDVYLSTPTTHVLVGRAYLAATRRGVTSTFRYDDAYLRDRSDAFAIQNRFDSVMCSPRDAIFCPREPTDVS